VSGSAAGGPNQPSKTLIRSKKACSTPGIASRFKAQAYPLGNKKEAHAEPLLTDAIFN
jgi:hypothetical protein